MGPVAGLAAGLGLVALASHLGFGEALANMMMIALLVMAVLAVIGFVMRKRAAGAGRNAGRCRWRDRCRRRRRRIPQRYERLAARRRLADRLAHRGGLGSRPQGRRPAAIPADFDTAAFARNAKTQFLALQSANDARDLDRLRDYLTPEMFDVVARGAQPSAATRRSSTEVFGLEAQVLDVAEEADRYIVSVRFTGSVRDQHGAVPEDLDEIWHLTKPRTGVGGWVDRRHPAGAVTRQGSGPHARGRSARGSRPALSAPSGASAPAGCSSRCTSGCWIRRSAEIR